MSSEWGSVEIGAVAKLRSGFPFKSADWTDEGVPVIKIANVKNGRIVRDGCGFVAAEVAQKTPEWFTKDGDVLIAMTGYVGEVALVQTGERYLINQRVGRFEFHTGAAVDPKFFFYHLQLPETRSEIEGVARGSAQPNLSATDAHKIKLTLPPVAIQKEISGILGALDDRITLLRETNTTLEAIAQALFKSWFVDFDPVHAKMQGRAPEGMDEATAALFPDSFEDSELGPVPKGWQVGALADLATFQNGYAFKSKDWTDAGHPVIKIGNVKPGLISFDGCSYVGPDSVAGLQRFKLERGDLLVGMTGYVGETGLVTEVSPAAYLNQRVGRIATSEGIKDLGFVFCLTRHEDFKAFAEGQSHGSAQANVSGADLLKFKSVIPSHKVLSAFNEVMEILIESILSHHEQAKSLGAVRDALLPKLISGFINLAGFENV